MSVRIFEIRWLGALVAGFLASCGGIAGDDETFTLGFDTAALQELEIESVLVEAFGESDINDEAVDCDRLLANPADTSEFLPVAPSILDDVDGSTSSMTLVLPTVPPGPTWFLVVGFSGLGGGGRVNAAGCGFAEIARGEKATVVVRMEPVE
jgi:hypothetical protein